MHHRGRHSALHVCFGSWPQPYVRSQRPSAVEYHDPVHSAAARGMGGQAARAPQLLDCSPRTDGKRPPASTMCCRPLCPPPSSQHSPQLATAQSSTTPTAHENLATYHTYTLPHIVLHKESRTASCYTSQARFPPPVLCKRRGRACTPHPGSGTTPHSPP